MKKFKRFVVPVSRISATNYIEGKKKQVSRGTNSQICTMGVQKNVQPGKQNIYTPLKLSTNYAGG